MEKTLQVINENLKMYGKDYNVVQRDMSKEEYIRMMSGLNRIETFEEALDLLDLNYLKNNDILNAVKRDYDSCCVEIFESRKR